MVQTRPRLVIHSLGSRSCVTVSLIIKKMCIYTPALSLNICPSYSRLNLDTDSSVLKAMYARECTFSLFSLIESSSDKRHRTRRRFFWHLLLLQFSRTKLLPKDSVIRHPRLYGLPKYRFGEVRGQPAHDGLEAFRPANLRLYLALFSGFGSRLRFPRRLDSHTRHGKQL
jgi:hypothetical protein